VKCCKRKEVEPGANSLLKRRGTITHQHKNRTGKVNSVKREEQPAGSARVTFDHQHFTNLRGCMTRSTQAQITPELEGIPDLEGSREPRIYMGQDTRSTGHNPAIKRVHRRLLSNKIGVGRVKPEEGRLGPTPMSREAGC